MPGATSALYEPLIARDLEAIPAAVRAFREEQSSEELFLAVARFAVLAFAPSQHGKHAVLACLSAWELREELGDRFDAMLIECARYAADARQPWSEPPILDPPEPGEGDVEELRAAVREGDRLRAERWLAARLDDPRDDLFRVATDDFEDLGHKLIVTNAAWKLATILGDKGRYAMLRVAVWELTSYRGDPPPVRGNGPDVLTSLLTRCIADRGSIDTAHAVFLYDAGREANVLDRLPRFEGGAPAASAAVPSPSAAEAAAAPQIRPYRLSRDYGAYLKAHAVAKRLDHPLADGFVNAVHDNLREQEGFEGWQ